MVAHGGLNDQMSDWMQRYMKQNGEPYNKESTGKVAMTGRNVNEEMAPGDFGDLGQVPKNLSFAAEFAYEGARVVIEEESVVLSPQNPSTLLGILSSSEDSPPRACKNTHRS